MAEATASISWEPTWVDPDLIIKPGGGISEPSPAQPFTPPPVTVFKDLVVDIETTGETPFDNRIIAIASLDPNESEPEVKVFMNEDEQELIKDFMNYFVIGGWNRIVGYNTIFDKRFIFVRLLYYRLTGKELVTADIYDIMHVLTNVEEKFVPGFVKGYKLDDWAKGLLGDRKTITIEEMFAAWEDRDLETIKVYVENDVIMEWLLYLIIEKVRDDPYSDEAFGDPPVNIDLITAGPEGNPSEETNNNVQENNVSVIQCSACMANNNVPNGVKNKNCDICGNHLKI